MPAPRKHHYLPQSCLRRFSFKAQRKHVWVFDKTHRREYLASIEDVGCERDYYLVNTPSGGVNFENHLRRADDKLAEIQNKIEADASIGTLSDAERLVLCELAAIQHARAGAIRGALMDMAVSIDRKARSIFPNAKHEALPDENTIKVESIKTVIEGGFLRDELLAKDISLYRAPSGSRFWISDNPIVWENHSRFGESGLGSKGAIVHWPLSGQLSIGFHCTSIASRIRLSPKHARSPRIQEILDVLEHGGCITCTEDHVVHGNALQFLNADRVVFSPMRNFDLAQEILSKSPEASRRPTRITMDPSPRAKGPTGTWLVVEGREILWTLPVASWKKFEGCWEVELAPEGSHELGLARNDIPTGVAKLVINGVSTLGIRDAVLEPVDGMPLRTRVLPADPGLRHVYSMMSKVTSRNRERSSESTRETTGDP